MCGFVAVVSLPAPVDSSIKNVLKLANDRMFSRGPDSAGEWFEDDETIGMAHRRLAIIDLSPSGYQPMHEPSGRYVIVFNGEIYNYGALKSELESLGYGFASNSDTAVLLAAYMAWGEACLQRLRGMFALCIWDRAERTVFAARDAFGIKPLYYRISEGRLWVASQVKALAAVPGPLTENKTAYAGFLLWGHMPEPFTPFREIESLPPGHWLKLRVGQDMRPVIGRWCDLTEIMQTIEARPRKAISHPEACERLAEAMRDTVAAHRIADVPVGVFLSSGLDSTTLASLMNEDPEQTDPVRTVTLGFREYKDTPADEVPLAETLARQIGAQHTTHWVSYDAFAAEQDHLFTAMDQPTIDGVNIYFVAMATKMAGLKVALSGLGADELFGTYPSFR